MPQISIVYKIRQYVNTHRVAGDKIKQIDFAMPNPLHLHFAYKLFISYACAIYWCLIHNYSPIKHILLVKVEDTPTSDHDIV